MSKVIDASQFMRKLMLHMGLCVLCLGLVLASKSAKSVECSLAPCLNIMASPLAYSGTAWLHAIQLKNDIASSGSEKNTHAGAELNNTLRLGLTAESEGNAGRSTNTRWQTVSNHDRPLLHLALRFESKGTRLDIKPRRHSVLVLWRKEFF